MHQAWNPASAIASRRHRPRRSQASSSMGLPSRSSLSRDLAATAAVITLLSLASAHASSVPPLYDGFAFGPAASRAWKSAVLVEAFLDPLCSDSAASWSPLRRAVQRFSPHVALLVHPFPLPYHHNAFLACRALYIASKLNASSTFPLLELFFQYQEKYYNAATANVSADDIISDMSKFAVQAVGNSLAEFQSGFTDPKSDTAARLSFKYGCTRGVFGAPFFFVNGFLLPGGGSPVDYDKWISVLEPLVTANVVEQPPLVFSM